jgi:N-acetylmuramoyl-L-alanine amidase
MSCFPCPFPWSRLHSPSTTAIGLSALTTLITLGSLGLGTPAALGQTQTGPTAPTVPAAPTVSGGRIIRPTLRLGSQGESVKELQSMLMLLGYYTGPISGVYQEDTQVAVQRFQRAAAITTDGVVGPATWSQLFPTPAAEANPPTASGTTAATNPAPAQPNPAPASIPAEQPATPPATSSSPPTGTNAMPILRHGMRGDEVRQLQQRLRAKGVYSGAIDGIFGSQTEAAVRQIQQTNNLTVDGIVGPATWRILN